MLLSRFWYVLLGLAVGALLFVLSLSLSIHNRSVRKAMGEGLSSDSQVVSWYLKDDARTRSAHLVKFAIEPAISKTLQQANQSETELPATYREEVQAALLKVNREIPADQAFDAVFAIDKMGRVVGSLGYPQAPSDFELGGYPVVADALHGYIRDDTLVWERLYRVVARPVQVEAGMGPAGVILGARIIDEKFARELSERTGAAVAFYVDGQRAAAGAPDGFPKANLDQIITDLESLKADKDYEEKGRSGVRELSSDLAVQYTRLPGESYVRGGGFAVGRMAASVSHLFAFFERADDKDKSQVNWILVAGGAALAMILGLVFSFLEHTVPLRAFEREALRLAAGQTDQLQPSKFRGAWRKIAAELNDGIDKVAATQGGLSRKAANLEQVLGELPAQPQMAAFSVPEFPLTEGTGGGSPTLPQPPARNLPQARKLPGIPGQAQKEAPAAADPEAEWPQVYEQFVQTKIQCGENVENFTFERFRETLIKNREAIVQKHGATEVKFSVYVKEGRAALKASPVKV